LISFCAMFVYVSLSLSRLFPIRNKFVFVDSKFFLGLCSILLVGASLVVSAGLCSIYKLKASVFITVVIPFLVLSIGLDNVFVLVDTFENTDPTIDAVTRCSIALSEVGSSMTLASVCESLGN